MMQPLNHHDGSPLDSVQYFNIFLVLRSLLSVFNLLSTRTSSLSSTHSEHICLIWLQGCHGRLCQKPCFTNIIQCPLLSLWPQSQPISSQKANRLVRCNLCLVNPCCLLGITLLFFICLEMASRKVCLIIFPETGVNLTSL